jgi:hypothetical protein
MRRRGSNFLFADHAPTAHLLIPSRRCTLNKTMTKDIEIRDVALGSGDEAQVGNTVVLNLRVFLHRGEEVSIYPEPMVTIDLKGRRCIAGLRKGLIGMRVGGKRTVIISPHLAYGAEGLPGKIPPDALLRYEIELLEVREPGTRKPEDFAPGKSLSIFRPGEAARNLPRWQFKMDEDGHCGAYVSIPIPGISWRHTRTRTLEWYLDPEAASALIDEALSLPIRFPQDCLANDRLWSDSSEPANGITRDRETDALCLTFSVFERGQRLTYYALKENSAALLGSGLHRDIELHIASTLDPPLNSGNTMASGG